MLHAIPSSDLHISLHLSSLSGHPSSSFVYLYLYNIFIEYTHTYTTIFADNICLAMLLLHSPSVRSTANSHNLLGQPMIALDHVVRLWYSFCDAPHLNAAVLSHFPVVMCQCLVPRQQVG